jgi:lipopolysaccharide exporter
MTDSALAKSARGSAYNIAVSAITIILGLTRSVLLMRFLEPAQFGVVALALFFATFVSPFSVFGIDGAIIQNRNASTKTFSTHFVLRLVFSLAILGIGFLVSPILRRVYGAAVIDVFLVLLFVNVLQAAYSTPTTIIRRELRFGAIAALNLAASLGMTITAPLLAYLGAGVWSLVAEQAIGPAIRWIGLWVILRPWQLSLRFDWDEAKSSLKFGSQVLSSNVLGILLDRFDDFWAGTALGTIALGFYSRAYEIAQYPERVLATPITNVFFSTYASLQENSTELSKAFFRSSSFLIRVGFLFAIVLAIAAPEITLILFGRAWVPIIPIFRLMLIYVVLDPLYSNLSYLMVGVGHPEVLTRVRLLQAALFIAAVIGFATLWNTNGIAMAANLMMLTGTVILLIQSRNFVRFSFSRMFLWPTVTVILSALAGLLLITNFPLSNNWLSLASKTIIVSGIYISILYFAERDYLSEYISQILLPLWHRIAKVLA